MKVCTQSYGPPKLKKLKNGSPKIHKVGTPATFSTLGAHNFPLNISWWSLNLIDPQIVINYFVIVFGSRSIESLAWYDKTSMTTQHNLTSSNEKHLEQCMKPKKIRRNLTPRFPLSNGWAFHLPHEEISGFE